MALPGQLAAFKTINGNEYAIIISEPFGTSDGFSLSLLREAIVFNIANVTGVTESDVAIFDISKTSFEGLDGERIALQATLEGLDLTYVYTVLLSKSVALQIITYSVSKGFGDKEADIHKSFLDTLNLSSDI